VKQRKPFPVNHQEGGHAVFRKRGAGERDERMRKRRENPPPDKWSRKKGDFHGEGKKLLPSRKKGGPRWHQSGGSRGQQDPGRGLPWPTVGPRLGGKGAGHRGPRRAHKKKGRGGKSLCWMKKKRLPRPTCVVSREGP